MRVKSWVLSVDDSSEGDSLRSVECYLVVPHFSKNPNTEGANTCQSIIGKSRTDQ